jgi:RNA polymerase sigma factor (sigma-70 family)
LAEDVTQVVFTAMARKAAALARRQVLGGWLYRTAQFAAIDAVRAESRRRKREQEAHTMHETPANPNSATAHWQKLRPVLEEVIGELPDDDRDAVVLRFFEGKSFADVGRGLRLTENAARMRVERALEKLHSRLSRRGVTSTAAALSGALASQAGVAAPAGLAASVTGLAMAGGASAGGTMAVFMGITKLQTGTIAALLGAVSFGLVGQARSNDALATEAAGLREKVTAVARLRAENERLSRTSVDIVELRKDGAEVRRLIEEALVLKQQMVEAKAPPIAKAPSTAPRFVTFNGDVGMLETLFSSYERIGNVRITKDAAVAALKPRAQSRLSLPSMPAEQAMAIVRDLLREKWNVVLEPAADGSLLAKLAGP